MNHLENSYLHIGESAGSLQLFNNIRINFGNRVSRDAVYYAEQNTDNRGMRILSVIFLALFLSACGKEQSSSLAESSGLVGDWHDQTTGDEVRFDSNGTGYFQACAHYFSYSFNASDGVVISIPGNTADPECPHGSLWACTFQASGSQLVLDCGLGPRTYSK